MHPSSGKGLTIKVRAPMIDVKPPSKAGTAWLVTEVGRERPASASAVAVDPAPTRGGPWAVGRPAARGALLRGQWAGALAAITVMVAVGLFLPLLGWSLLAFIVLDTVLATVNRRRARTSRGRCESVRGRVAGNARAFRERPQVVRERPGCA
jgi:hypothetical protein